MILKNEIVQPMLSPGKPNIYESDELYVIESRDTRLLTKNETENTI